MNQSFQVGGMHCGHCANAVQEAVLAVDPQAQVSVQLETGRVDVVSAQPREALAAAITQAGYTVQ